MNSQHIPAPLLHLESANMTTLAQDLFYQSARREWRRAMNECLAQWRRVCVI